MIKAKQEQGLLTLALVLALAFGVPQSAGAMHIAEGYLPAGTCIAWGAVCLPFVAWGLIKIRRLAQGQKSVLVILAMAGAFAFVLSALKIPSVSASSSHPTGTGLGAILFGPAPMAVLGLIVLLFQALLLAHGGLTTLGANTLSRRRPGGSVHLLRHQPPAGPGPPQPHRRRDGSGGGISGGVRPHPDPPGRH